MMMFTTLPIPHIIQFNITYLLLFTLWFYSHISFKLLHLPSSPYHLVHSSYWPFSSSLASGVMMINLALWLKHSANHSYLWGMLIILLTSAVWWRDVIREATFCGAHTQVVMEGLQLGMIMFISSEVMFFSAFFWMFFNSTLNPDIEGGSNWPPHFIDTLSPLTVPLLNTMILLSSGFYVTWAHDSLIKNNKPQTSVLMIIGVALGLYFTALQGMEYLDSTFKFNDSIYGSSFFIATGFHGLHVLVGSMFLIVTTLRIMFTHMSQHHHMGFEAAAWYWHFVDVVWLFLFASIYNWGAPMTI